jgi:hypothetical protein
MIWNQIIQTGDPINILGHATVHQAVDSPGAVQQLNQITEQVSLETGGDPTQVKGVVQNLALTNSIEGGNPQELINNIKMEVAQPNDPVSKSFNSLAMQEEKGNYEAVNTAVEKVAEGAVGGNDVKQLVTTAAATTTDGAVGGELGAAALDGGAPSSSDEETTEDQGEIAGEIASEEDDDSDSGDEAGTADEDEAAASDDSEGDGGGDTEVSADDEGDDSDDGGDGDGGGE